MGLSLMGFDREIRGGGGESERIGKESERRYTQRGRGERQRGVDRGVEL